MVVFISVGSVALGWFTGLLHPVLGSALDCCTVLIMCSSTPAI